MTTPAELWNEMVETITRLVGQQLSYATVNEVAYLPSRRSVLVNVTLQPSGVVCNARLGLDYVGAGRGMTWAIKTGQECLVAFPGGDRQGGVILRMLPNGVDLVSTEAAAAKNAMDGVEGDDWWIRVRGNVEIAIDENLILHVTGDETEHVEGNVDRLIDGDRTETIAGDETVGVEMGRSHEVGLDDELIVGVNRVLRAGATIKAVAPVHDHVGVQVRVSASELLPAQFGVMNAYIWGLIRTHTHPGSAQSAEIKNVADALALTQVLKAE